VLATKLKAKKPATKCASLGMSNNCPAKKTGIKTKAFFAQSFGLKSLI
jgi:hypothetical protein